MNLIPVLIPLALVLFSLTVLTSVVLSYSNEHVTYFLPYISDTGALPPESCYFGQGLNFTWIIVSFIVYIKYVQVEQILASNNINAKRNLNGLTLIVGMLFAFGISIVANFQEFNLMVIHWIGAFSVFGCGSVYTCLQTSIYFKLKDHLKQENLSYLRIIIAISSLITFLLFFLFGMASYAFFEGENYLNWKREDGGFLFHQISAFSEWICGASIASYLTLFWWEFKQISIKVNVNVTRVDV